MDPEWLAELGPMFFSIKESHSARVQQRRKEREAQGAMALEVAAAKKAAAEQAANQAEEQAKVALQKTIATPGASPGFRKPATPRRRIGL